MGILDLSVASLGQTNGALRERLRSLGEVHGCLGRDRFTVGHWDAFAEAMLECVIEGQGVHAQRGLVAAWRAFIIWMIDLMKDGYYATRAARAPSSANNASQCCTRTCTDVAAAAAAAAP